MASALKPLIATVALGLAVVFVGFGNSTLAHEGKRYTKIHGGGCLEVNGEFFLKGEKVRHCSGARPIETSKEPVSSGYVSRCNGKAGDKFVTFHQGKWRLAICK